MKDKKFEVLRERFLKLYDKTTAENYSFTLNSKQVKRLESHYNKDVSQFNDKQAIELLYSLKVSSFESIKAERSKLKKYTDFIISEKLATINSFDRIQTIVLRDMVSKRKQKLKYLSKDQVYKIVGLTSNGVFTHNRDVNNDQDSALIMSIFEGIKGSAVAEISNLKYSDINWDTGLVKLTNEDETTREIIVSNYTLEFLKRAYNEENYLSYSPNNYENENLKLMDKKLIDSPYIFKKTTARSDKRLKYSGIRDRFKEVMLEHGNDIVNISGLVWSGAFNMARDLKLNHGELEKEHYIAIANKYDKKINTDMSYSRFKGKINKHLS